MEVLEKYRNDAGQGIIQETKRILDGTNPEGSFPQTESALGQFQGTLNGARVPPQAEADNARTQLSNLRNVLGKLRSLSGSIVDISKARKDLLDLIQKHLEIEKDVIALREKELELRRLREELCALMRISVTAEGSATTKSCRRKMLE